MARPFKNANPWTSEEDELLLSRLKQGERAKAIERNFPNRSVASVKNRLQKIRKELGVSRMRGSIANSRATKRLADAINALIAKMPANDVAAVLGRPTTCEPGQERVYRGQAAERAFARPIGEIIAPIVADIMDRAA